MKGQPFLVPDLDVPTRWNSTYMMINKFRRIREMTDILVASNAKLKEQYPTDEDWDEINVSFIMLFLLLYLSKLFNIYIIDF